ncbi:MAG: hypothetical protein C0497_06085 [Gemmatimonas sp.]|nr:hypothetical protein [Gemmatimonas sp.]
MSTTPPKTYRYSAYGFDVVLSAGLLEFRPAVHNGRPDKAAVLLALLALRASAVGEKAYLPVEVLADFPPWQGLKQASVGNRVWHYIARWEAAHIPAIAYKEKTVAWRLASGTAIRWTNLRPADLEAGLSSPGLAEWRVDPDAPTFDAWLAALSKGLARLATERLQPAARLFDQAVAMAPSVAGKAGPLLILAETRQRQAGREHPGIARQLSEMAHAHGAIGRTVRLHRYRFALLDTTTVQAVQQRLSEIETELRRTPGLVSAGDAGTLLATTALAWRRTRAFARARATAAAALACAAAARDLLTFDRALGELFLAAYQDAAFRNRATYRCVRWGAQALRLERHLPISRENCQVRLVIIRGLTRLGRTADANAMLMEIEAAIRTSPRAADRALAAVCRAQLEWALVTQRLARTAQRIPARDAARIAALYAIARRQHEALGRPVAWFSDEADEARQRGVFVFTRRRRTGASAPDHGS